MKKNSGRRRGTARVATSPPPIIAAPWFNMVVRYTSVRTDGTAFSIGCDSLASKIQEQSGLTVAQSGRLSVKEITGWASVATSDGLQAPTQVFMSAFSNNIPFKAVSDVSKANEFAAVNVKFPYARYIEGYAFNDTDDIIRIGAQSSVTIGASNKVTYVIDFRVSFCGINQAFAARLANRSGVFEPP